VLKVIGLGQCPADIKTGCSGIDGQLGLALGEIHREFVAADLVDVFVSRDERSATSAGVAWCVGSAEQVALWAKAESADGRRAAENNGSG
jgi:hypothetical protein